AERGVGDQPEDINVDELIHRLYNEYHPEAQAKGLQLNLQLETNLGTIHSSRLYLQELLQNLITNAIKYTRKGSITIDASVTKSHVKIAIIDTGIGISKADQKRVFDKFYRAEDYRTRETNGTGLGLYVAMKLAKKLGSRLDMTSRLNHGSTFSISLPITRD
ncbi:HAMP domain-containing histidine kinase, partial [Candidatus Saccharibacteria bacterium]|nr:HAMP domain-containing histidine kinase [Candidatus Saccharibacteria bacterium]